jgi:ABC-type amino acid transport system permease subunit
LRLHNGHGVYTQRGSETFIFVNLFSLDVLTLINHSEISAEFTLLPNHHAFGVVRRIIQEATRHVFQVVLLVGILSLLQINKIKPLEVTIMRSEH